jgi:hypothetical protein
MAVDDEVRLPDAIKLDRLETAGAFGQLFEIFPPLPQRLLARQEGPVEIALPLDGADDPFEGNILDPAVHHVAQVKPRAHLVEREQVGGALQEVRQEVLHQRDPPGAVEPVHGRDPAAAPAGRGR